MGEDETLQDQDLGEEPEAGAPPEVAEEKPKAKAPDPRLPVRLIAHKDGSALVEWIDAEGKYRRAYVPLDKLDKGTVATKDLEKGIPHGLPWEKWIEVIATPERIANELRRRGVWTWEDINNAALNAANTAFDRGEFMRRVKEELDNG